jgi:hypothetical protein
LEILLHAEETLLESGLLSSAYRGFRLPDGAGRSGVVQLLDGLEVGKQHRVELVDEFCEIKTL